MRTHCGANCRCIFHLAAAHLQRTSNVSAFPLGGKRLLRERKAQADGTRRLASHAAARSAACGMRWPWHIQKTSNTQSANMLPSQWGTAGPAEPDAALSDARAKRLRLRVITGDAVGSRKRKSVACSRRFPNTAGKRAELFRRMIGMGTMTGPVGAAACESPSAAAAGTATCGLAALCADVTRDARIPLTRDAGTDSRSVNSPSDG